MWTQNEAIELCKKLESFAPKYGECKEESSYPVDAETVVLPW